MTPTRIHLPSLAIFVSTFIWGTWWIPLRKLDELGNGTIWLIAAGVALPALILLPHALKNWRRITSGGWPLFLCGLALALTCTFYAEGAMRGNVARVILLFYLTPVWSTLLARWLLREPITRQRLLTIALGMIGMWIILGGAGSQGAGSFIPRPADAAEWMGLIAGMFWAISTVSIQKTRKLPMLDIAFPGFALFALCFIAVTLIPGGRSWQALPAVPITDALLWIVLIAVLWHLPAILLTLFGAADVEPGRVAILLMMEVVVGVGSAALLTDDVFGLREMVGALFIISAGIAEFIPLPNLARPGKSAKGAS